MVGRSPSVQTKDEVKELLREGVEQAAGSRSRLMMPTLANSSCQPLFRFDA